MNLKSFVVPFVGAVALAGCSGFFGSDEPDAIHPKCLPHIVDGEKPAGQPVKLVEKGEVKFVVVGNRMKIQYRNTVNYAWSLLCEAFEKTTGQKLVFLDAEKDRAKWEKADAIVLLGDSVAARAFGFDEDKLGDQELFVSTFEKVGVKSSSSRKDVNSSLQLQLETPTQTIRGLAILGNETIKVGVPPPKGEKDARTAPNGVLYAAIDFCERFMDCRYFFPGENGSYFPKITDLTVDPIAYTSAPHFNTRGNNYGFYCAGRAKDWSKWTGKPLGEPGIQMRWRLGMTMELLGKHNPEPFGLYDAFPEQRKQIFYTSPNGHYWCDRKSYFSNYYDVFNLGKGSFADILVEGWKEYYASGRTKSRGGLGNLVGQEWINFGVTDVYMNPEDCIADPIVKSEKLITAEDFKRAREVDGRTVMANVYGRFYKHLCDRLAAELPGKKLFVLAYYNCKYAPTRYKLPENFDAIICDGSLLSYVTDPAARAKSRALFKSWYDAMGGRAPSMAYLYGCGDRFGTALTPEYIGEVVKLQGEYLGRTGIFMDGGHSWHRFYGFYIGSHQQWDPDFDAVAAFDDMADKMLGKAAAPMKAFHNRARANCEKYIMSSLFTPHEYPLSEVDALEALLNEAKAAVKDDPLSALRLSLIAEDWEETFKDYRAKMAKKKAAMNGVYQVAYKTGASVDWSKIPAVPGSNGLKFVWDEKGLYGRADGETHYKLYSNFRNPDQDALPLDYDTMVPGFTLNFSKTFSQKVYKMVGMKPFGRLRLLGKGDDPNTDETKMPDEPLGDLETSVATVVQSGGRKITLTNDKKSYTHLFGFFGAGGDTYRGLQCATLGPTDTGFFCYSCWLGLAINGIPLMDVNVGAANMKNFADGDKRGFEYLLNFDGARVKLRLYMKPGSPVLWGELEEVEGVKTANLRLNGIPSHMVRDWKTAKMPYRRQLRTAKRVIELPKDCPHREMRFDLNADDGFFLAQDGNYDGTAEDKGLGPCYMYIDMSKVEKGSTTIGKDKRDVDVSTTLKPGFGKVTFGVWEDRGVRHSNEEVFKMFAK